MRFCRALFIQNVPHHSDEGEEGEKGLAFRLVFPDLLEEVKELGFCFLLGAGFCLSLNSFLGHLAAAVGGLGLALVGASPATPSWPTEGLHRCLRPIQFLRSPSASALDW